MNQSSDYIEQPRQEQNNRIREGERGKRKKKSSSTPEPCAGGLSLVPAALLVPGGQLQIVRGVPATLSAALPLADALPPSPCRLVRVVL